MEMSGALFFALFAALGVSLSEAVCKGEARGVLFHVLPERCWYFCRRNYGKGGECEVNVENARCVCNGNGEWVDVGSCEKERQKNGGYEWIHDCWAFCKNNLGHVEGGECSWSADKWNSQCFCKNTDADTPPTLPPT